MRPSFFNVRRKRELAIDVLEQLRDGLPGEKAGRAAAHEDRGQGARFRFYQFVVKVAQQCDDVVLLGNLAAQSMGVEVAVRTFPHTPRKVDIERKRYFSHATG